MNKIVKGKGCLENSKKNILDMKNFFISENLAVLEFENEVLAVFGNNLYQFKEKLIKTFSSWKESNKKNPAEYAKEIMRGYFSEYFLSLDLKKIKNYMNSILKKRLNHFLNSNKIKKRRKSYGNSFWSIQQRQRKKWHGIC